MAGNGTSHSPFGTVHERFAEYYDAMYADRDYLREVNLAADMIEHFGPVGASRILELGCGTGSHSLLLAERGYRVVGVDLSPAMLAAAKKKAALHPQLGLEFSLMDVRALRFREEFDACVSLFGCFSYLSDFSELKCGLQGAARSLVPGGLFLFDFWNAKAVAAEKPSIREKKLFLSDGRILLRAATPDVDWARKTCSVRYRISVGSEGGPADCFEEIHGFRFFDLEEVTAGLESASLDLLHLCAPDGTQSALDRSWFLVAVARRASEGRSEK